MRIWIQKAGKFYSRIIINYIGIFLFIGVLSVIFGNYGWYPNDHIYQITSIVYMILIPCLIGYGAGDSIGGKEGSVVAVLAVVGIIAYSFNVGILGAMILGPICGWFTKWIIKNLVDRFTAATHMLIRNLLLAGLGGGFCLLSFYLVAPALSAVSDVIEQGINILIDKKLVILSSFLIEPAKIMFLNNGLNHGIFTPLGMSQAEMQGKSILFLLETNPGPGEGILCALYVMKKEKRQQFGAGIFAQLIGGIHEVYFPFVLTNLWLLVAAIGGSMAGIFCFLQTDAGLVGPVSPGSILTILMMAGRENAGPVLLGVGVSAIVSFLLALLILKIGVNDPDRAEMVKDGGNVEDRKKAENKEEKAVEKQASIHKLLFICDGGVGSSVMAAALFRRKLAEKGIADVEVKACAVDLLEEDSDLIVCQRSFAEECPQIPKEREIYTLENLLSVQEYEALLELIETRNG